MQDLVSRTSRKREPVFQGKSRVTGLWVRATADGRKVYELQHRVGGKPTRTKLRAKSQPEAIIEARGLASDVERGVIVLGDRSVTVEALAKSFIDREKGVLGTRKPITVELYEQRLRDYVVPMLGPRTKAADVTVAHLRSMIDRLRARGLAGSTIRGTRTAAAGMFRHGERDLGALPRNVVRDLDRGDLPSAKRLSEPRYLSVESVENLLSELSDETRPVSAALFYAALRASEALSLTWGDIDFDGATIAVSGTKTESSRASVPLLPALARELQELRQRKVQLGLQFVVPGALVFSTRSGRPMSRRNIFRAVDLAARRAGLVGEGQEPVGLHDLRHSMAASAFSLGLTPVEVSRLLRHADPRVTLTVYAGLVEGEAEALGSRLSAGGFGQ